MEIKCQKLEKKNHLNIFPFKSDQCSTMNFSDSPSGSCKRNVSEILDGSEVMTASYPRKRHNYTLPEKPSTVSYYPKDSTEKRCVGGALSVVDSPTCWPGSSSSQTVGTKKLPGNKGTAAWKPWQSHSSPKLGVVNVPSRRKSSSHSSKPPYVHPPLPPGATSAFAPQRRMRHGSNVTPGLSNFKKRSIKNISVDAKPPPFSKTEMKKNAVGSDEDQRLPASSKTISNASDDQSRPASSLSDLLAPVQCSELVGQSAVASPCSVVRAAIASAAFTNVIFWGPPGCGKSCMRSILSRRCSAAGSGWRFSSTSGALLTADHVRQVVKSIKASKHDKLLLFVDDLHCSLALVQNMLASCLDDTRVVLVGTCLMNPRTCLSAALVSRCDLYEFHALQVPHLEIILRRALKRLQISVLNREMELKDVHHETQEVKQSSATSREMQAASSALPEDSTKCSEQKLAPRTQELAKTGGPAGDKLTVKSTASDQSGRGLTTVVKSEPSEVQRDRDRADDNGIEDMSDDEDESILDVLTKDLDKISDEYKIEHEGEREEDKLVPNDLDCVSDDELSEHGDAQHSNSLESIDSSEDDLEDGSNTSSHRVIGITQGAMSVLCRECLGDSRVLLRVLQRLVRQTRASSLPQRLTPEPSPHRNHVPSDRKVSSSKQLREERRKSESGALRIANYGSKDSKNGRVITYVDNDPSLNTDDISSDEDNESVPVKQSNSDQSHVNVKVDDLDNVSDISDSSVNLCRNYDGQNPTGKTIADNKAKAVGSDESLSSDDILDYDEIEEDFDSEHETENTNKLSEDLRDTLASNPSKRSSGALHSHGRGSDSSSLNMKKERSLLCGSGKLGSVKCKLENMSNDGLQDVNSTNVDAGRTMVVITAKLVRQAFQTDEDSSLRREVEAGIRGGHESATLLALARLLRESSARVAAEVLLQAAISCVGVGDSSAVGRAVAAVEAVQRVTEPHARHLVANTAVWLARACKDDSAIAGLAAAERQIEATSTRPPYAASAHDSALECA